MTFYSLIIPVYNRPEDIEVVLDCLTRQTFKHFEVIVVESGSDIRSDKVVMQYKDKLDVSYYYKSNEGQGYSRNYGMKRAKGDFFIILDSDILLDEDYLEAVDRGINDKNLDAFGGPDRSHDSFTPTQKAIDFTLTSFYTTGGMRGSKNAKVKFYPRSFNMGFSRGVYEATNGFRLPFFGEDIELSARIMELGFKVGYIDEAYIYHKRKTDFKGFWKQMHFFGRARINISHLIPGSLKLVHWIPALFTFGIIFLILFAMLMPWLGLAGFCFLMLYVLVLFTSAAINHSFNVAFRVIPALFVQMIGYGTGFLKQFITHTLTGRGIDSYKPQKDI